LYLTWTALVPNKLHFAGIDFIESDAFTDLTTAKNVQVTNAKGQFSSSLAEYVFFACSYFAKDLPRLMNNKKARVWEKFDVQELRGKVSPPEPAT
jgi:phosphoglycerate dehydrogenase-like enzyme